MVATLGLSRVLIHFGLARNIDGSSYEDVGAGGLQRSTHGMRIPSCSTVQWHASWLFWYLRSDTTAILPKKYILEFRTPLMGMRSQAASLEFYLGVHKNQRPYHRPRVVGFLYYEDTQKKEPQFGETAI